MTEMIGIAPFATPAGYEIVYRGLQASRLIFLDYIPRSDIGCLPRIGTLKAPRECLSQRGGGVHDKNEI